MTNVLIEFVANGIGMGGKKAFNQFLSVKTDTTAPGLEGLPPDISAAELRNIFTHFAYVHSDFCSHINCMRIIPNLNEQIHPLI
jgi:hypothetical protein